MERPFRAIINLFLHQTQRVALGCYGTAPLGLRTVQYPTSLRACPKSPAEPPPSPTAANDLSHPFWTSVSLLRQSLIKLSSRFFLVVFPIPFERPVKRMAFYHVPVLEKSNDRIIKILESIKDTVA